MTRLAIIAITTAVLCLSSCSLFGGHEMDARLPTEGKKISVVPFREKDLYFLESKVGAQVAGLVTQILLKETVDTRLVDPKPAFDLMRDKNPDKIEWGSVAKALDVDYVVVGNILLFRSRDPKRDVNCYRGEVAVQVTVWRPDNSLALTETATARYPSGKFSAPVASFFDTTEEKVLNHLKAKAALEIARFFFPYSPSDD